MRRSALSGQLPGQFPDVEPRTLPVFGFLLLLAGVAAVDTESRIRAADLTTNLGPRTAS